MAALVYQPLNPARHEIRLIAIAPGEFAEPFACSMQVCSLEDDPRFEAISYVWGDSEHVKKIVVDGQAVDIHQNLYCALLHFRLRDRERVVWADALAINQADPNERAWQVLLMSRIYSQCSVCQVWLGEPNDVPVESNKVTILPDIFRDMPLLKPLLPEGADKDPPFVSDATVENLPTMDMMGVRSVLELLRQQTHILEYPYWTLRKDPIAYTDPDLNVSPVWLNALRSLENIMSRAWFFRIWIIQEAVLPDTVIFNLGQAQISLDYLILVLDGITAHGRCIQCQFNHSGLGSQRKLHPTPWIDFKPYFRTIKRIADLRQTRQKNLHASPDTVASRHLQLSTGGICTDPRDYVYGFLGVLPSLLAHGVRPAYDETIAQCFSKATKSYIMEEGMLDYVWLRPSSVTSHESLPSWVIDYRQNRSAPALSHASSRSSSLKTDNANLPHDVLGVRIETVTTVKCICPPIAKDDQLVWASLTLKHWFTKLADDWFCRPLAFWDTVSFGGHMWEDLSLADDHPKLPKKLYNHTSAQSFLKLIMYEWTHDLDKLMTSERDEEQIMSPVVRRALEKFYKLHQGFSVIGHFDSGGYGIVPQTAREGDVIAVIEGCPCPVALREDSRRRSLETGFETCDRTYRLVGRCWIEGMMDGTTGEARADSDLAHLV